MPTGRVDKAGRGRSLPHLCAGGDPGQVPLLAPRGDDPGRRGAGPAVEPGLQRGHVLQRVQPACRAAGTASASASAPPATCAAPKPVLDRLEETLHIKPGETTPDWNYSLETVNCLGACALGPIVVVDGKYSGQMVASEGGRPASAHRAGGLGGGMSHDHNSSAMRLNTPADLAARREAIVAGRDPNRTCITLCGGTGCRVYGSEKVLRRPARPRSTGAASRPMCA